MKIKFREIRLSNDNKARLSDINRIILEYQRQGFRLTLRQLYYQLVSRDVIPNKQAEYAKLSRLLVEGRMAGIVDWDAIEDRLRSAEKPSSWDTPQEGIDSLIGQYEKPRMAGQEYYIEVWVEKDALSGVLSTITEKYHIPILVNRGYSSVSAIYDSYKRFRRALLDSQKIIILYLGDYDPSGIDMIRYVTERPLEMLLAKHIDFDSVYDDFVGENEEEDSSFGEDYFEELREKYSDDKECFEKDEDDKDGEIFSVTKAFIKERFNVIPLALTRSQIRQYNPPPNPAKKTDPRAAKFIEKHGTQSWEVDALRPEVLNALLEKAIRDRIDLEKYEAILKEEEDDIAKLEELKSNL